jgi:DNA modification methylase
MSKGKKSEDAVSVVLPKQLKEWPIGKLIPYGANARTHSAGQVEELAASLREFGWTNPILAKSDGTVIAGHGRLEAAKKLGMGKVPVLVLDHLTEEQARAYVIADNRLAQNAGWDEDLLAVEVGALEELGFDVSLLGFTEDELRALGGAPEVEEDSDGEGAEEAPERAELGQVWLLGDHRVACGDSTDAATVSRARGDLAPVIMITDPPYGVEYDPAWRDEALDAWKASRSKGVVENDDRADWQEAYSLFPGDVGYVWHPPGALQFEFWKTIEAAGFEVRMQCIWAKSHFPVGRGHYHVQHEPCYYIVRKGGGSAHWRGSRKESTLWEIAPFTAFKGGERGEEDEATGHGTQKPVECMARPMRNHGEKGDVVYDPFLGSGSTLMAAEMLGRVCVGVELNPRYVDAILARWEKYTGKGAVLENG